MSEELNSRPHGERLRARVLNTKRGRYVHVGDIKQALMDEGFLLECAAMIRIAKELKHPPLMGVKMAVLHALTELAEIDPEIPRRGAENAEEPPENN